MSDLYAFLHPELPEQKEIVLPRFKNRDGKVVPFVIKPLTAEENEALLKRYMVKTKDRGRQIDSAAYQRALIVAGTVVPDFRDAQLCEAYGVLDPAALVGKMLLAGESLKLADEILTISGLDEESAKAEEEEAKN